QTEDCCVSRAEIRTKCSLNRRRAEIVCDKQRTRCEARIKELQRRQRTALEIKVEVHEAEKLVCDHGGCSRENAGVEIHVWIARECFSHVCFFGVQAAERGADAEVSPRIFMPVPAF